MMRQSPRSNTGIPVRTSGSPSEPGCRLPIGTILPCKRNRVDKVRGHDQAGKHRPISFVILTAERAERRTP